MKGSIKKTGLPVHAQAYKYGITTYSSALKTARSNFYSQLIHSNSPNPRTLFSTFAQLTKPKENITTKFTTDKCNNFLSFYQTKFHTIHCSLVYISSASPLSEQQLSPLSPDSSKLIPTMKFSNFHLYPIPSPLLKTFQQIIIPLISSIINSPLVSGSVTSSLRPSHPS